MNSNNQPPQSSAKMTDMEVANEILQLKTKVSQIEQAVNKQSEQSSQDQAQQEDDELNRWSLVTNMFT